MRTNNPIRLHSKCLKILEMIQENANRIQREKERLYHYDTCKNIYAPIILMNNRDSIKDNIYRLQRIDERLVSYYNSTFLKLISWLNREMKQTA